jgi:glycosyltransferase involved in cell wall biosynthesis
MERAFYELVRGAHERYEFVVFASELAPELGPLVEWRRVPVVHRPIPLKFVLFFLIAGARLARANVDLVHTMGALVPNRADLACVQFCHAGFAETVKRRGLEGRPLLRKINTGIARALGLAAERWWYGSRRVRMLAAVSEGVGRELERHYPGVPVVMTPNGVDAARFEPHPVVREEVRAARGVRGGETVALFVGGDWDRKGLHVAISGLARAKRRGAPALILWVVGRGDQARFRALAERHGITHDVSFFGPLPRTEVEQLYEAADVFVLPTIYETFSLAAHEAAAAGLPVVATRVSGVEDLVGESEAGLLVERSAEAFGDALARLALDPRERARLGRAARRRAHRYKWSRSVQRVLEAYARLLPAGSPVEEAA